jgi:hypothetical protein
LFQFARYKALAEAFDGTYVGAELELLQRQSGVAEFLKESDYDTDFDAIFKTTEEEFKKK